MLGFEMAYDQIKSYIGRLLKMEGGKNLYFTCFLKKILLFRLFLMPEQGRES